VSNLISWDDAFKLSSAILASLGGGSVVVLGFFSFLGAIFSDRFLEAYKGKNQRDLEKLRSETMSKLESLKTELSFNLEVSKRFSEKQFYLYNELWSSLCDLKIAANNLWEMASRANLQKFSRQLRKTEDQILRSSLLIDDTHYVTLTKLLKEFSDFKFGKTELRDLRVTRADKGNTDDPYLTTEEIKRVIDGNGTTKDQYLRLLRQIEIYFKNQIRGAR